MTTQQSSGDHEMHDVESQEGQAGLPSPLPPLFEKSITQRDGDDDSFEGDKALGEVMNDDGSDEWEDMNGETRSVFERKLVCCTAIVSFRA